MTDPTNTATSTEDPAPSYGDLYASLYDKSRLEIEVVSPGALSRVGARPPIATYLRLLWQRRHFLWLEAKARVGSGNRETLLGKAWLILNPVLDGMVFYVMFGLVLQVHQGIDNFVGFLLIGVFLFGFASRCLTNGAKAILSSKNMIRAFQFPRASLPISVILREILNLGVALAAMLGLLALIPPAEPWTWHLALAPAIIALLALFTTGLALLFARVCSAVPDFSRFIAIGMRMLMWGSGVMFPLSRFENQPVILALVQVNPFFIAIDMCRTVILQGAVPPPAQWFGLSAWAIGTLVVGFLIFWQAEESYGRA